jgi:2-keto-4-pentenoate hydratase/2-oxohepta-3-ene-1,7-dioic acid hydratase in catechol pathway
MRLEELWVSLFGRAEPGKIVCVGLNYVPHAAEADLELPTSPLLFGKFANTLVGPNEAIQIPAGTGHVDAEAELACVIGRKARNLTRDDALAAVYGYTVANDVSARELQFADGQWFRGKSLDTFCPVLPTLVPAHELGDAGGLRITQRLNGELLQDATTSDLIFDVPALVSFVSQSMTLEPGDLLLTGTPEGVGYFRSPPVTLSPGDEVEIEIERIGVLRNPVAAVGGL